MFHYWHLTNTDPEEHGNSDASGRNLSFKTAQEGPLPEEYVQLPCQPQMKKVSSTGSVLIFCHKQLSLKLHVKAGSNSLAESTIV